MPPKVFTTNNVNIMKYILQNKDISDFHALIDKHKRKHKHKHNPVSLHTPIAAHTDSNSNSIASANNAHLNDSNESGDDHSIKEESDDFGSGDIEFEVPTETKDVDGDDDVVVSLENTRQHQATNTFMAAAPQFSNALRTMITGNDNDLLPKHDEP